MIKKRLLIILLILSIMLPACSSDKSGNSSVNEETAGQDAAAAYDQLPEYDWNHLTYDGLLNYYNDDNYESERLIDVSSHQNTINWDKVVSCGFIDGCILRIGRRYYGKNPTIETDEKFAEYYAGACSAGLKVFGVYFYTAAVNEAEAKEEAEQVLAELKNNNVSTDVTVFLDLESKPSSRTCRLEDDQIKLNADTFCKIISDNGYKTGIYTNGRWSNRKLDISLFEGYGIWYARYNSVPDRNSGFYIWQYKKNGSVPGISGNVDVNLHMIRKNS